MSYLFCHLGASSSSLFMLDDALANALRLLLVLTFLISISVSFCL